MGSQMDINRLHKATQCERDCLGVEVPSAPLKDDQIKDDQRKNEMSGDKTHGNEIGGPKGLEPTRYGDWEVNGRCSDF